MEWVYVAIIIGAMVYAGGIVVEYTNQVVATRPKIKRHYDQALQLSDVAECEQREVDAASGRRKELRAEIAELQHDIDLYRTRLKAEGLRHKRLEMVLLRTRLRHVHQYR